MILPTRQRVPGVVTHLEHARNLVCLWSSSILYTSFYLLFLGTTLAWGTQCAEPGWIHSSLPAWPTFCFLLSSWESLGFLLASPEFQASGLLPAVVSSWKVIFLFTWIAPNHGKLDHSVACSHSTLCFWFLVLVLEIQPRTQSMLNEAYCLALSYTLAYSVLWCHSFLYQNHRQPLG